MDSYVQVSMPLTITQNNASTLNIKSKTKLYLKQLEHGQVHIGGLEETRFRHTGITTAHGYVIASAAATSGGHGGCSLVVSLKLDFGEADSSLATRVASEHVSLIIAEPRFLLVRIAALCIQMLAAVIHGLDESYVLETVVGFWKDTAARMGHHRRPNERCVTFVDGNCGLGKSDGFGPVICDVLAAPAGTHSFRMLS